MIQRQYTLPHVLMVMNVQKELQVMMMEMTMKKAVTTKKMMLKVMKTKLKKKAMRKKKKKKEDYGLRKSLNTSEEMILLPHKLTQLKVLKKTLKQKVTTVKMMVKMTKKEMMKKEMTTKRKRKKEDYGSKNLPNILVLILLQKLKKLLLLNHQ